MTGGGEWLLAGDPSALDGLAYSFSFTVETQDGAAIIKDNSLSASFNRGNAQTGSGFITEDVFTSPGLVALGNKRVEYLNGFVPTVTDFDELDFAPQSAIRTLTAVNITANQLQGDLAGVDSFELRFSQLPIPGAVWLLGSALVGLLGLRRRFTR